VDPLFATSEFNLSSAGVGLRLTGPHGLNAMLDLAQAFNASGSVNAGDVRVHFRIAYDW
jgi:hemolysin activation/secretion protein